VLPLGGFTPAVGVSAVQAAHLQRVSLQDEAVVCIENLTTFYEFIRHIHPEAPGSPAVLCLAGNPAPACRHLLACLAESTVEKVPLRVWADLDYGGLNILSQLRRRVSAQFVAYRMDVETLERYAAFGRPMTPADIQNLKSVAQRAELADLRPVIDKMLQLGLKLEQEAIEIRAFA
jgi:hypothetical protein